MRSLHSSARSCARRTGPLSQPSQSDLSQSHSCHLRGIDSSSHGRCYWLHSVAARTTVAVLCSDIHSYNIPIANEMLSKQVVQTKQMLSKQAVKIAKQAEEHERFINKDICCYANTIFLVDLFYPRNEKFFMVCFSFAEGSLAWALIVWHCSLVFSSVDKIVSVLIHLLPGLPLGCNSE